MLSIKLLRVTLSHMSISSGFVTSQSVLLIWVPPCGSASRSAERRFNGLDFLLSSFYYGMAGGAMVISLRFYRQNVSEIPSRSFGNAFFEKLHRLYDNCILSISPA